MQVKPSLSEEEIDQLIQEIAEAYPTLPPSQLRAKLEARLRELEAGTGGVEEGGLQRSGSTPQAVVWD